LVRVKAVPGVREAYFENGSIIVTAADPLRTNPLLVRALIDGGAQIAYVTDRKPHLEAVHLRIVEPIERRPSPAPPPAVPPARRRSGRRSSATAAHRR